MTMSYGRRFTLSDDRKNGILRRLQEFYRSEFDEDLSDFRAEQILSFFLKFLGPDVYNQAIQDARGFMLGKLEDLDTEFYERETD